MNQAIRCFTAIPCIFWAIAEINKEITNLPLFDAILTHSAMHGTAVDSLGNNNREV